MPNLDVHHQLLEVTQTHAHWVSDAIQPSHPLSSPSPSNFNLSQHQVLSKESVLHIKWSKYYSFRFSVQSWTPRTDLLQDGLVGSPCSPRDSQEYSPMPQFKSINSSAFSFFCSPTLTSIHDHWKTIAWTRWTFAGKVMSLLFSMLSRLVITFLPKSKSLLILWL